MIQKLNKLKKYSEFSPAKGGASSAIKSWNFTNNLFEGRKSYVF